MLINKLKTIKFYKLLYSGKHSRHTVNILSNISTILMLAIRKYEKVIKLRNSSQRMLQIFM